MDAIKDIIPRVIAPLSAGKTNPSGIAQSWRRLCSDPKTSGIAGLKDGCLTVHVDCSARMVKMNMAKADYLDELKSKHPEVKDIKFKVGKIT